MDVQKFTAAVISIVVVVVIAVTVLVPIIQENQLATTGDNVLANAGAINSILNVIPLLVIVGIIIAVIGLFISKRN